MRLKTAIAALVYGLTLSVNSMAAALYSLDIPAGELTVALDLLGRQTHAEFIYSPNELKGLKTPGVHGELSAETALNRLVEGTDLVIKIHPSGAILITRGQAIVSGSRNSQALRNHALAGGPSEETEVVVIGARRPEPVSQVADVSGIKAIDGAAPVLIVGPDALTHVGQEDLIQGLLQSVPWLNYSTLSGDTATLQSYVRLRGLNPNDTLVLVDGKRRHGTADLVVDNGPFQGAAGADLGLIPVLAIDHVEVLTDDAAAQYGTDAIAGVINIILKRNDRGGLVSVTGGQYFEHQGNSAAASVNFGLAPLPNAFLNLTVEFKFHGHSDLRLPDPIVYNHDGFDNVSLYPDVVKAPGYPDMKAGFGDPLYRMALLVYNGGINLDSGARFYSFGTFGYRYAAAYENYRTPNRIPTIWPLGFNPIEALYEFDFAVTAGIKGTVFHGWNFDLSSTYGSDNDSIHVDDSANLSLYEDTGGTPTDFYAGAFIATQWMTTLDLNRDFDVGVSSPMNVAFGVEGRHESYSIAAGEPASRYDEGSQSYSGFTQTDAGYHTRSNESVYVDLALSPVRRLQFDAAGRFEHYSDFGDARLGKLTARWDFMPTIAVRGTISNGFRAPTLAEEHYSATNIAPTSGFVQLAPNSPGARLIGIDGLKPETSINYSLGLVAHPWADLTATLDAYQIDIKNRVVGSGNIFGSGNPEGPDSPAAVAAIQANGNVLDPTVTRTGVNVFNNGADTRTRGLDLVVTHSDALGAWGRMDWSFSASYDPTVVTKVLTPPIQIQPQALLNRTALAFLSTASPKYRMIAAARWQKGQWSLKLNESLYGPSSLETEGDDGHFYSVRINATPITSIMISYAPINSVRLSIGADNVFNTYPNRVNPSLIKTYLAANDDIGTLTYPRFSPFGVDGGYYFARIVLGL